MNPTIFVTTLRQRFSSRTRLLLIAVVFLFPIAFAAMARELGTTPARGGAVFAWLLGAGLLGQESASGVFQLLFARPIRRWEYVVSRWLAVIAGAGVLMLLQLAIIAFVSGSRAPTMHEIVIQGADQMLAIIGTTSVILLFSSFLSGVGDVLGMLLATFAAQILGFIGQLKQSEAIIRTKDELVRFLGPELPIGPLTTAGGHFPWFDVVSYLSTITLCLAVAIWVLNRREISYASE